MRYLILASLGTILFFAAYWLLMRRETRFTMVRYYLVGALLLSFVLPLVHLSLSRPLSYYAGEAPLAELAATEQGTLLLSQSKDQATAPSTLTEAAQEQTQLTSQDKAGGAAAGRPTALATALWVVYGLGCLISLLLLGSHLLRLRKRLRGLPYKTEEGLRVSLLKDRTPAFSFGNHIVVGTEGFSDAEVAQLVGHERVHVRQHHSLDCLLCEAAKVVLWFNPFVWLYSRELKRLHEYLADSVMLNSERGADYAQLFYHQVSGKAYSPLANTFDYGIIGKRIGMMARRRSRRGWLLPLVALPVIAVVLLAGCTPKSALNGYYAVGTMQLKSDNPAEPTLVCSEFLGLENRVFGFSSDGRVVILDQSVGGEELNCTYTIDDKGLHIYDSNGNPWLNMTLETVRCDKDSIVVRFVDADPIGGMEKMLAGLPSHRYRIDTVNVSHKTTTVDGEIIEVDDGTQTDTIYAKVVVPCEYGNWDLSNRLLSSTSSMNSTFVHQYKTASGNMEKNFGTSWEFDHNKVSADARQHYDTTSYFNPKLEGDRFVLEVSLKKVRG